jgi:predicted ATPase
LLDATRLLILTGAGGSGKTRLALQAAAELVDSYLDGVWLVELAALRGAELVPHEVATAIGIREERGRLMLETLASALRGRQMLVILDNCEHLIQTCASLVDGLLRVCAHMRILATSRETLSISGEEVWRVPPLRTADPAHIPKLESVSATSNGPETSYERGGDKLCVRLLNLHRLS